MPLYIPGRNGDSRTQPHIQVLSPDMARLSIRWPRKRAISTLWAVLSTVRRSREIYGWLRQGGIWHVIPWLRLLKAQDQELDMPVYWLETLLLSTEETLRWTIPMFWTKPCTSLILVSLKGWCSGSLLMTIATRQWSRAVPAGPRPSGRYGHSLNILGSKIYVFGGQVEGYFMNDLVAFDLNQLQVPTNRWEMLIRNSEEGGPPQGQIPPARTNHSIVTYNEKLYL